MREAGFGPWRHGGVLVAALNLLACQMLGDAAQGLSRRPPPAPQPLPSSATSQTLAEDRPMLEAWASRSMLDAYDRVGLKDPRWDAKARALLELSVYWWTDRMAPRHPEEAAVLGREAVALGCPDPMVLYAAGMAIRNVDPGSREGTLLLQRAVDGMKEVRYPRAGARYVASGLHGAYEHSQEHVGLRRALAPLELRWFVESLRDGSYQPDEDAVLVRHLTSGSGWALFKRNKDRAKLAVDATPWVDEWARLLVSGAWHQSRAWDGRGNETASKVTAAGWKKFEAENRLAHQDWLRAWKLRPDRHEAAYHLMETALHLDVPGETPRLWFDRTVAARFDYRPAYEDLIGQLRPRWGGSYEAMLDFGREALATGRFDTEVPLVFLTAVHEVEEDQADVELGTGGVPVYERPETFPTLQKMLDGYLDSTARPRDPAYYRSLHAIVSTKAGRYEIARQHLGALDYRLDAAAAYVHVKGRPGDFVDRVTALGGAQGAKVKQAEEAGEALASPEALGLYREALRAEPEPHAARFLRHRIAGLAQEQALAKGGWVDLEPTSEGLEGWEVSQGSLRREKDGALLAATGVRGYLAVASARVGPEFELAVRMEFVASTNGEYQGGIVFGRPDLESVEWMSFRLKRNPREGNVACFSQHLTRPWLAPTPMDVPDVADLLIRVAGGRLTAVVNGRPVIEDLVPPAGHGLLDAPDVRVGLGAYLDENQVSVRYRGLRVRRLPRRAP
jgi:hypothetical protein